MAAPELETVPALAPLYPRRPAPRSDSALTAEVPFPSFRGTVPSTEAWRCPALGPAAFHQPENAAPRGDPARRLWNCHVPARAWAESSAGGHPEQPSESPEILALRSVPKGRKRAAGPAPTLTSRNPLPYSGPKSLRQRV